MTVQITGKFPKSVEGQLAELDKKLGEGNLEVSTGNGNDWMEIAWTASDGRTFYHRVAQNPAVDGADFEIGEALYLFEYNRDHE